jgi:hypothetical protein
MFQLKTVKWYFKPVLTIWPIDTGSPLIRCNFTTLDCLVLFSRKKCFETKKLVFHSSKSEGKQKGKGEMPLSITQSWQNVVLGSNSSFKLLIILHEKNDFFRYWWPFKK